MDGAFQVERGGELGALFVDRVLLDERGMAADLAQPGQSLKDGEAALAQRILAIGGDDHLLCAGELVAIQLVLHAAHFAEQIFFGARWQFARHLALGAAQNEGAQACRQALRGALVLAPVEVLVEVTAVAQGARCGEAHEAPQIEKAVFQRRAGEHEAVVRAEFARSLGGLAVRVFDLLPFVENGGQEVDVF